MPQKKCKECGSVWTSGASKCAFCGGEGEDLPEHDGPKIPAGSAEALKVKERETEARKKEEEEARKKEKVLASVSRPTPPPSPTPTSVPPAPETRPEPTPEPAKPKEPTGPTVKVPLILGILSILSVVLPPLIAVYLAESTFGAIGFLFCGLFAICAPIAVLLARRYEKQCKDQSVDPSRWVGLARGLGRAASFLIIFEFSALLILIAIGKITISLSGAE